MTQPRVRVLYLFIGRIVPILLGSPDARLTRIRL